ncbi:hypothetical protein G4B88_026920 [Cannabis sativa]|uniref:RNase H type-1 domain-containing protein n=1 Tax=Cannabis sativa TaxID=3483 RepID=A0A7J6EGR1_CANSA|nr:hypothetical protein G4B88_026920 [Cannabis sativa]
METKRSASDMEGIWFRLGFLNGVAVSSVGAAGGLALFWRRGWDIQLSFTAKALREWNVQGGIDDPQQGGICVTRWGLPRPARMKCFVDYASASDGGAVAAAIFDISGTIFAIAAAKAVVNSPLHGELEALRFGFNMAAQLGVDVGTFYSDNQTVVKAFSERRSPHWLMHFAFNRILTLVDNGNVGVCWTSRKNNMAAHSLARWGNADREGGIPLEITLENFNINGFTGMSDPGFNQFFAPFVFYNSRPLNLNQDNDDETNEGFQNNNQTMMHISYILRYWSHVVNCSSCSAAHKGLKVLEVMLRVMSIALIGYVGVTNKQSQSLKIGMVSMALLCFVASKWLSHFIHKIFHFHDHAFR